MTYKHHHSIFTGIRTYHSARSADNLAKWVGSSPETPLRCFTVQNDGTKRGQRHRGKKHKKEGIHIDSDSGEEDDEDSDDSGDPPEIKEWEVTDKDLSDYLAEDPNSSEPPNIRLVICHEADGKYHMNLESFKIIDKLFNLPTQSLSILSSMWGAQSSEFEFKGRLKKKGRTLDIVIRTPSIEQFSQCGIAVTYDLDNRTSSAFIRGANAVRLDSKLNEEPHTLATRFRKSLKWTRPLWKHPLLLPVILLSHEIRCIMVFARKNLHVNAQEIAEKLSIDSYGKMSEFLGGRNRDRGATQKRTEFTARINDLMRNAINARRGLRSAQSMIEFLQEVLGELEEEEEEIWKDEKEKYEDSSDSGGKEKEEKKRKEERKGERKRKREASRSNRTIRSYLRSFDQFAKGLEVGIDAIISDLEVQLNLVSLRYHTYAKGRTMKTA